MTSDEPEIAVFEPSSNGSELKSTTKRKFVDWTTVPPPPDITPFQQQIHDVDWENSPLGPMKDWPIQLRQLVMMIVADSNPGAIYWDNKKGVEYAIIYNEATTHLIGELHPAMQGQDPSVGLASAWLHLEKALSTSKTEMRTVVQDGQQISLERSGFLEEAWFDWRTVPVVGPDGYAIANYVLAVETTRVAIADRMISTIRAIDEEIIFASKIEDLWPGVLRGLSENEWDIPLAMLYSVESGVKHISSECSSRPLQREGFIGDEEGDFAPFQLDLVKEDCCISRAFRDCETEDTSMKLLDLTTEEYLPFMSKIPTWRGFGAPKKAIAMCIRSSSKMEPLGYFFIALNPRRVFDTSYKNFISLLLQQLTTAVNQLRLDEELKVKTMEAAKNEMRFSRFAERAPIGIAIADIGEGMGMGFNLQFANQTFYDLTGYPEGTADPSAWMNCVIEEDKQEGVEAWMLLQTENIPIAVQTRLIGLKGFQNGGKDQKGYNTVLTQAFPDLDESGVLRSVMVCITDISELKTIEEQLRQYANGVEREMKDVLEMKRLQENFVDMTSHEIRNPMSAVLHCAEDISDTINELLKIGTESVPSVLSPSWTAGLNECLESSDTINYCMQHQKRIVDDILVLSRLDSQLLELTPVAAEPVELVQQTLKMFEVEAKAANMSLTFQEDPSIQELEVSWLKFDPNRVTQILVNLVGNAIKFTKAHDKRDIVVSISAHRTQPSNGEKAVEFIPERSERRGSVFSVDMDGKADTIYLSFSVTDSGQGLSTEEKKLLFERFSQASPKTHTQYGGSGLGLFICRQLAELHGGRIGVSSEAGQGCNFFFYIETRQVMKPAEEQTSPQPETPQGNSSPSDPPGANLERLSITKPLQKVKPFPMAFPDLHLHVLVVEDNLVNQKVVLKQLRKQGCTVHVANNGQEALEFIKTTTYWKDNHSATELSVVLMDLEMPVMDGISCVKAMRQFEKSGDISAHIPTIAVTANARQEQLDTALRAGMDEYIVKPYRVQDMMYQMSSLASRISGM